MLKSLSNIIEKTNYYLSLSSFIPNFIARLYLAQIFFDSGISKLANWSSTLFLFQYEYHVPLLNHVVAACLSVFIELGGSVLLVIGLGTRYAALVMLAFTFVMKISYSEVEEVDYWMIIFTLLAVYGGDKLSFDYLIKENILSKFFGKKKG